MPLTALNRTEVALLTNKSGGSVAQGDVVVIDGANASAFTTTTTVGFINGLVGVVLEPNGIADSALGLVAFSGYVPKVTLSGSASLGDLFKTHSVAKQAVRHAAPGVAGDFGQVLATGTTPAAILFGTPMITAPAVTSAGWNFPADGRLTLASGMPVTTTDQTAKTTLYYTPYIGTQIALYDGASTWNIRTFAELSVALGALTASKPYDVFCYDNAGTPTLEVLVWTNPTTRATALAYQNGILVKSGATTRRYLGTIYITAAGGQCEDSLANRLVFNYYNRVLRPLYITDATATWTINTQSLRQARANAANQVAIMCGVAEDAIALTYAVQTKNVTGTGYVAVGIGRNSTSAYCNVIGIMDNTTNNEEFVLISSADEIPILGYSYYAALEENGANNATFTGGAQHMALSGRWKA